MKLKVILLHIALVVAVFAVDKSITYVSEAKIGEFAAAPVTNITTQELALLVEDVRASTAHKYDAKDHRGSGLDALKVIQIAPDKYVGVYHYLQDGTFVLKVAESTDLINWKHKKDLDTDATHGDIMLLPRGDFLVAYEKKAGPDSFIRVRHYKNYRNLKRARHMKQKDIPRTLSTSNEGTPHFISVDKPNARKSNWSGSQIVMGFHYLDGTDKNAIGTLTNFSNWQSENNDTINDYFDANQYGGNYGDRDDMSIPGASGPMAFDIIEGQTFKDRWESWRSHLYDGQTETFLLLDPYSHGRSIGFANATMSHLMLPSGQYGYFVSYFMPSEGSVSGEAGQLIFYTSEDNLPSVTPIGERDPIDYDQFTAACNCFTPGGSTPDNGFYCSDGEQRYCAATEYCTNYAIQPAWPCAQL